MWTLKLFMLALLLAAGNSFTCKPEEVTETNLMVLEQCTSEPISMQTVTCLTQKPECDDEKLSIVQKLSEENIPIIQSIVDDLREKCKFTEEDVKFSSKDKRKIAEKAHRPALKGEFMRKYKIEHGIEHVRDSLRFKARIRSVADVEAVVTALVIRKISFLKVDFTKLFHPKEWGWRIIAIDLLMPNGQFVEFYMAPYEMDVKKIKGPNHEIFEKWRNTTPEHQSQHWLDYNVDLATSNMRYAQAYRNFLDRNHFDTDFDFKVALEPVMQKYGVKIDVPLPGKVVALQDKHDLAHVQNFAINNVSLIYFVRSESSESEAFTWLARLARKYPEVGFYTLPGSLAAEANSVPDDRGQLNEVHAGDFVLYSKKVRDDSFKLPSFISPHPVVFDLAKDAVTFTNLESFLNEKQWPPASLVTKENAFELFKRPHSRVYWFKKEGYFKKGSSDPYDDLTSYFRSGFLNIGIATRRGHIHGVKNQILNVVEVDFGEHADFALRRFGGQCQPDYLPLTVPRPPSFPGGVGQPPTILNGGATEPSMSSGMPEILDAPYCYVFEDVFWQDPDTFKIDRFYIMDKITHTIYYPPSITLWWQEILNGQREPSEKMDVKKDVTL